VFAIAALGTDEEGTTVRLMLLSNSTSYQGTPLAHARAEIGEFLSGRPVLFVPFALADHESYTETIRQALAPTGSAVTGLHRAKDPVEAVASAEAFYVGGGNTFRLLATLQGLRLMAVLRQRVLDDAPYLAASAGTNLACPTIRTTNDMPIVEPAEFGALGLVPFQMNPHYLDPAPDSRHMGESREQRIQQFHEENDVPVLGVREGGWLTRDDDRLALAGSTARLFRRGVEPQEVPAGTDLSDLLAAAR
jgi:dipeptidase E